MPGVINEFVRDVRTGEVLYLVVSSSGRLEVAHMKRSDATTPLRVNRVSDAAWNGVPGIGDRWEQRTMYVVQPHARGTPAPEPRFHDFQAWRNVIGEAACQVVRLTPTPQHDNDRVFVVLHTERHGNGRMAYHINVNSAALWSFIPEVNTLDNVLAQIMAAADAVSSTVPDSRAIPESFPGTDYGPAGSVQSALLSPSAVLSPTAHTSAQLFSPLSPSVLKQSEGHHWSLDRGSFVAVRQDAALPAGQVQQDLAPPVAERASKVIFIACAQDVVVDTEARTIAGQPCYTVAQALQICGRESALGAVRSEAQKARPAAQLHDVPGDPVHDIPLRIPPTPAPSVMTLDKTAAVGSHAQITTNANAPLVPFPPAATPISTKRMTPSAPLALVKTAQANPHAQASA